MYCTLCAAARASPLPNAAACAARNALLREWHRLLRQVALNLVEHPAEPKFRRIKMDNQPFRRKVLECAGGTDLFLCLGTAVGMAPRPLAATAAPVRPGRP